MSGITIMKKDNQKDPKQYLYLLFATAFHYPEQELSDIIKNIRDWITQDYPLLKIYTDKLCHIIENTALQELQIEYTKLFLGPANIKALPYASSYLEEDGLLMGETSRWVENIYREINMKVNVADAPDHVAIELEFLYLLRSKKHFAEERVFLEHFNSWYPQFQNRISQSKVSDFYTNLSLILLGINT